MASKLSFQSNLEFTRVNEGLWHNPFVFPTNRGDSVLLRMCKVFQDGGHANRNRHYILILGRKYEEFFVVLLSFLHNAIYSIQLYSLSNHTV